MKKEEEKQQFNDPVYFLKTVEDDLLMITQDKKRPSIVKSDVYTVSTLGLDRRNTPAFQKQPNNIAIVGNNTLKNLVKKDEVENVQ